ncbi:MAG: DOMON-like domain-containing protein [Syntrophobacteraceae bacterium]|nr:DOMON-like domain-containing protein [Desulfobacteraceae bacterium]
MNERRFFLQPFAPAGDPGDIRISGVISRRAGIFSIRYELGGRLDGLALAPPAAVPGRRNGLWEETCFEFFLAEKESPVYREFNLSPSGNWNVYRFSDYRKDMREEETLESLPFRVARGPDALKLSLEVDLGGILRADWPVEAAVSAVIRGKDGSTTYWALTHHGPRADFHHRDGFILQL